MSEYDDDEYVTLIGPIHIHRHRARRRILVSLIKKIGDTVTLTAAALEKDGVTADPNAQVTWSQTGAGGITLASKTGLTVTGTCDTAGDVTFSADAKDPDGNDVTSSPFTVTVVDPATDTATVTVTGS